MITELNIEERVNRAKGYHEKGYNCAQSVVLAYNDIFDLDTETATKASCGFGAGVGKLRQICGCVSGMAFLSGFLKKSPTEPNTLSKFEVYNLVQELSNSFKEVTGSVICSEMLGLDGNKNSFVKKLPCTELVALATRIFGNKIKEIYNL